MAENRNMLRSSKSKAPMICTVVILSLMGLAFIFYACYAYLGYITLNDISEPGLSDVMDALGTLFKPESFQLPITFDVVKEILVMQVRDIWWVYVGIALAVFLVITSKDTNDFRGIEHGSARWANEYDKKKFTDNTGIPCGDNFYITLDNPKHKYKTTDNLNEIVIGGSGAGKSFRKIKPDIMQMTGSYVVTDPSGELYRDTAKMLRAHGYEVKVFNLKNIMLSNTYNPFDYVTSEPDVLKLAKLFMNSTAQTGEKGDFWTAAAEKLLKTVMLYLFHSPNETKSFGKVIRLLSTLEFDQNGKISENCEIARCVQEHQLRMKTTNDALSVYWQGIKNSPAETFGGIRETLDTRLANWAAKDVDMLTSTDEMNFDDLGVKKTAIFMILETSDDTYRAISNLFYSQLFQRLRYIAETKYNNRLPLLVSCELDEFANVGQIPEFNQTLSVIRKYNIRICIVLQGLSQLKAIYEKTFENILSNCSIFTFLGTNDQDSIEYVSKKLGETTVRTKTKNRSTGNQGGGSEGENYTSRRLLKPEEIPIALDRGPRGKCIVKVDRMYPFFLDKFDTLNHPLIGEVGSSFKKDWHNNSGIEVDYAGIYEEHEKKYLAKQRSAHIISEALKNGDYDGQAPYEVSQEEENRRKLKVLFESNNSELMTFNDAVIDPSQNYDIGDVMYG